MSCKKCKCKVCSCIKNDVPKIAVNGIVQNQNENDVVNIKVPTKTSQLINDSGFGQGNGGGTGGQKIENIRVNGELAPILNKEVLLTVPTKTSDLINNSNFVTKPYVDTHIVNKANPHNVTKEQVGLGNVDNTSDLSKPISTATQNVLNSKLNTTDVKSEVVYEDLKPVNSQAVEKYAVKKINTIADLRNTQGEYEGQIVSLLGYYEAGDKKPLSYKWVSTQSVDDGGAVINTINGSWIAIFDKNIKVSSFGCINSKNQNSNAQFQNTINYAVLNKKDIDIDIDIYISETININRVVDGEDSSDYMYISGGSITVAKDLELFSSSLTYFPNEPASQLIYFKNINLIGDGSNFFMKGNKLLRIIISGCSFLKLNFCKTDYYIQSIYFDNCNIRDIKDCFLTATNGSYDLRFTNNLVERGDNFIDISGGDLHKGQLWVDGNVIEGFSGYAIRYSDMSVMTITNNYFESNSLGDVVKNSNKTDTMDTLIIIENNFMYGTGSDNTGGAGFFHVVLGWVSRGSFSKNVGGNRNLVYLKSICGMSIEDNFGDHTINKVGKRSKMYFYEDLSGEATAYEDYIEKGSIIWNTDIKDGNSWIGAICTSDKLNYIESTWLKFGEDFVKNKVLISSSNLNDFTQSGVFFSENSIIKNIENNFPISEVGVLEVLADNDPDRSNFMQRYTSMITNTVFTRTYYGTGGSWTPWFNLTNKDVNSPDATDLNTAITLVNELKQKLT